MTKNDLRAQGYSVEERFPRPSVVNAFWAILTLIFIIGTFGGLFFLTEPDIDKKVHDDTFITLIKSAGSALTLGMFDSEVAGYFLLAILMMFLYLFLKLFMTIIFCRKSESIKFKLLESKGMPMCLCREALKVWQTVLIYLVPFILTYSLYIFLCIYYQGNPAFMVLFFFQIFFMVFDLTLIIYLLIVRLKDKPDYIAIDHHIYGYTVFKKTYVKFSRRKKI